jgi:predicted AlkP superfamily phosphohydrolase/phosphomutase
MPPATSEVSVGSRILLLGLDGAAYSILTPAFEAGHMPALKELLDRSASGVLRSTVPPYTPPGWTSIFTGVNPGKHGIIGFTDGNAQRRGGLVRLSRVRAPAIWDIANAQGAPMGVFNVPMTYPPPQIHGFAVSGMLTPEEKGWTPENFSYPPSVGERILDRLGHYEIDIELTYHDDWRSPSVIDRLRDNVAHKRQALKCALEVGEEIEFLFVVSEAFDRLLHMHYKYLDPGCDHFHYEAAEVVRHRAWNLFDEIDALIGELVAWAGSDGFVVTASDHGFGPKDKNVNVDLALEQWGLLSRARVGRLTRPRPVRMIASVVKDALPRSRWERVRAIGRVGGGPIDWSKTKAFSAPGTQQGIYINLEGREPNGTVSENDYELVRDEVVERMEKLVDPVDGNPVTDRVFRREEVMEGPATDLAPDLFPVCRGYAYELMSGLHMVEVIEDQRSFPRGFHHMDGIFAVAGPGVSASTNLRADICDIALTTLYLAGLHFPPMDGKVLLEQIAPDMVAKRPPVVTDDMDLSPRTNGGIGPYSPEEELQIERSLRNLGYL